MYVLQYLQYTAGSRLILQYRFVAYIAAIIENKRSIVYLVVMDII